jgi:hypothetical protein
MAASCCSFRCGFCDRGKGSAGCSASTRPSRWPYSHAAAASTAPGAQTPRNTRFVSALGAALCLLVFRLLVTACAAIVLLRVFALSRLTGWDGEQILLAVSFTVIIISLISSAQTESR